MVKRARFDGDAFYAALDGERQARQCTWKRVAEESGISASTSTRIARGSAQMWTASLRVCLVWAERG